ncbi:MaoC family dehydratase [Rhodococcoides yunnanense]|uniref:MaoC family dehydratase n=1 Tax=Rhodococcoides yunnanense TaxID=278209 RepID=UPI0009346CFC|nr:MaoC family dehydratase [Rhodococcus yunnanensis]
MSTTVADLRSRAVLWPKGKYFEDFEPGRTFSHHWGRTLTEADNITFSTLTSHYNPAYFNSVHAAENGHPSGLVNPMLVFLTVFGLSVEDLSETGVAFLGVDDLTFHSQLQYGDTVTARSTVESARRSAKNPKQGIVTWHTEGRDQHDNVVIDFLRTNLVNSRGAQS